MDAMTQNRQPREPDKTQALSILRQRNIPVGTVIDVGIGGGTPELMRAYPDREHILFEPVEEFFNDIAQNYATIPHRLVKMAVSDHSGTTKLATTSIMPGMTVSHSWIAEDGGRTVPMTSLDDYFGSNHCADPFFLKLDVDGHEMSILKGAERTLRSCSVVMIEATVDDLTERLGFLQCRGFRLFDLAEPCYYDNGLWNIDVILVRQDIYADRFLHIHKDFDVSKYQRFVR